MKCPACSTELPPAKGRGRPRIWCSPSCRAWVAAVGGPLSAAEIKDAFAATWSAMTGRGQAVYRQHAAACRAEAGALRALADRTPETCGRDDSAGVETPRRPREIEPPPLSNGREKRDEQNDE
jgi:hypothetical protein